MQIKFKDNSVLEPLAVTGGMRRFQGADRDVLNFVFPASAGLDALDAAFTGARCENIVILDGEGGENLHKGYTIRAGLVKETVEVTPATAETEAVYEDRITVSMAQRTYAETQMAQLQAAVAALTQGQ